MKIHPGYPYPVLEQKLKNGLRIAYCRQGKGEQVLLFVHGFASYLPSWSLNINRLQKYYTCIALDLPGHGLSESGDQSYSMRFFSECLRDFIECLDLPPLVLIGHSMGGQISVHFAHQYSAKVEKLVLVAPAGLEKFSPQELFFLNQLLNSGLAQSSPLLKSVLNFNNYFHDLNEKENLALKEFRQGFNTFIQNPKLIQVLGSSLRGMLNEPARDLLGGLRMPVQMFFGKQDRLIPNPLLHHYSTESLAQEAIQLIPKAKLSLYDDCGHFLQYEKAAQFNIDIFRFLRPELFE